MMRKIEAAGKKMPNTEFRIGVGRVGIALEKDTIE